MSTEATEVVDVVEAHEARNRAVGIGVVKDVYPTLAALREAGAVCPGSVTAHFPGKPMAFGGPATASVLSHAASAEVLRRNDTFTSQCYADLDFVIGRSVIGMDEPDHRRMRNLLQAAFAKSEMAWWTTDIIQPVVDEHLSAIAHLGKADLYDTVAAKVPIHTIITALGLAQQDRQWFFDQTVKMQADDYTLEQKLAACKAVADYIAPLVVERRATPGPDLLSILVNATVSDDSRADGVDDRPLNDEEIGTFVRLLVIAGAGTTFRAYANLMWLLLTHRDQYEEVVADRSLIDAAVEESLRYEQPLTTLTRRTSEETEIDGFPIPAGANVQVSLGAANHDPAKWPDPEQFDIHRPRVDGHLTFGWGVHRCLGVHLARTELRVLLDRTIDLLPNLRLDPDRPAPETTGVGFRVASPIHVLFDV